MRCLQIAIILFDPLSRESEETGGGDVIKEGNMKGNEGEGGCWEKEK